MAVQSAPRTDHRPHPEVEALVAAHALDALDPAEGARIERHLRACPACRRALRRHRETIGLWIAAIDLDEAPPDWLWTAICTQLDRPRALPRVASSAGSAPDVLFDLTESDHPY